MYERFTDGARKVMQLANDHAQRTGYEYIETEHVLLGLISARSGAGSLLLHEMYDARRMVQELENAIGAGQVPDDRRKLPMTPQTKQAIEDAMREAREAKQKYVGTEHLLLALLRQQEGVAAEVLEKCGVTYAAVRSRLPEMPVPHGAVAPAAAEPTRESRATDPQQVDRLIRQAVGQCWQSLPVMRRNADEVATQIRRTVERALRDFNEDAEAFGS